MVWEHVRRFLIIWIVIIAALIVGSLVVYGSEIMAAMSSSVGALVELLVTAVIVIGIVVMLIRGLF